MNGQPLIAEQLNNYRREDLFYAAEESRATKISMLNSNAGSIWTRLIELVRLGSPVKLPVAQSTATGGQVSGN